MSVSPDETTVWKGHPSWKSMLLFYVKWTILSLVPVAAWVALDAAGSDIGATWFAVATGIGLVLTYAVGWIRRQTTRYIVTNRRIHIRTGIVSRNERTTHIDRVQNVNLSQNIFQRMLGIGDVDRVFEWLDRAAAERDTSLIWLNADPRFEQLRTDLRFISLASRLRLVDPSLYR